MITAPGKERSQSLNYQSLLSPNINSIYQKAPGSEREDHRSVELLKKHHQWSVNSASQEEILRKEEQEALIKKHAPWLSAHEELTR